MDDKGKLGAEAPNGYGKGTEVPTPWGSLAEAKDSKEICVVKWKCTEISQSQDWDMWNETVKCADAEASRTCRSRTEVLDGINGKDMAEQLACYAQCAAAFPH